jgi:hypothetical protein
MWGIEDHFHVILGGNTFIDTSILIRYKGSPLFSIERSEGNDDLGISFVLFDENGQKIAHIKENRIYPDITIDVNDYAFFSEKDRYTMTEVRTQRAICDIKKREEAAPAELDVSVKMYTQDGLLLDLSPTTTNIKGLRMSGNIFIGCSVGIDILEDGSVGLGS